MSSSEEPLLGSVALKKKEKRVWFEDNEIKKVIKKNYAVAYF